MDFISFSPIEDGSGAISDGDCGLRSTGFDERCISLNIFGGRDFHHDLVDLRLKIRKECD